MQTIGVVGVGFVGTAVAEGMYHAVEVIGIDAKSPQSVFRWNRFSGRSEQTLDAFQAPKVIDDTPLGKMVSYLLAKDLNAVIFVCVPTPMKKDGSCDVSIVSGVVQRISEVTALLSRNLRDHEPKPSPVVVIKSTVTPGTTEALNQKFDNVTVCFNPEFLTERNAVNDFKNQDRIIIGGPHQGTAVLKSIYQQAYPNVPTTKTHSTIAEMVKYVTNCFLATKVTFANEIYQICNKMDIDYDKVIEYATKDQRLGLSHWAVPGPDGQLGFGGKCFPKDLNCLIHLATGLGLEPRLLEAAWSSNLAARDDKDWLRILGAVTEG